MPRIAKKESVDAVKDRLYRAEILRGMEVARLDVGALAELLGVSLPTMRKKIREPGCQTLTEARRICRVLSIDPGDFGEYI